MDKYKMKQNNILFLIIVFMGVILSFYGSFSHKFIIMIVGIFIMFASLLFFKEDKKKKKDLEDPSFRKKEVERIIKKNTPPNVEITSELFDSTEKKQE